MLLLFSPFMACDLEENPPYLSDSNVYTTEAGIDAALNGIFSASINHFYFGADYHHLTDFSSGFFTSGKASDRSNIAALSPYSSQNYPTNFWKFSYVIISRSNDLIAHVSEEDENANNRNMLGIAHFLRAYAYFNLVRLYGGVPLHLSLADSEGLHIPRASADEVFDQIIADAKKAEALMFEPGMQTGGRPGKYAANMLLAKVHMWLAGNDSGSPHWQQAYDEAIKVYGQYSLVPNYADLWNDPSTANNNSESIFEIQFNEENPSKLARLFTPKNYYPGNTWQRIKANPETVDDHMTAYPDDPRIGLTFLTEWEKISNGKMQKVYPSSGRTNFGNGFPFIYKFAIKDRTATSDATNFNFVVYRYADLLLMLAEIENELGMSAEAHAHVNEVLARARNSAEGGAAEPTDWSGLGQDEFREKIMKEYQFELLAEGHDWFNNRRRGYEWFKTHIIIPHNERNEKGFDIEYPDDSKTMLMPIPSVEINANNAISPTDQNPGY